MNLELDAKAIPFIPFDWNSLSLSLCSVDYLKESTEHKRCDYWG
jgi:hypothetical protein